MGRLHKRYGKRKRKSKSSEGSSPKRNPPLITDLAEFIGPGFVGFAATRFGTRVAATQIAKRKPSWAKHAGALASIGAFLAAWLLANRVKFLAKYQTPIAVGAGIAAAQSLIQLYIPKLGWMVADATPEIHQIAGAQAAARAPAQIPAGLEYTEEDPSAYTYNDSYDAGRYTTMAQGAQQAQQTQAPGSDPAADAEIDLENEMQEMGAWG